MKTKMDNPRNEKEILENIKVHRDKIKKLGKYIGDVESWNDESFLSDMDYHVEKLYNGNKYYLYEIKL